MMKVYICPECGWVRVVSRRKDVECYKCGNEQMKLTNLEFTKYSDDEQKKKDNRTLLDREKDG